MVRYYECYSEFKKSNFKGKIKESGTKLVHGRQYYYIITE